MDKEKIMQQWDYHRSRIAEDNWGGASEPRDWFESIIEWIVELEAENERLRGDVGAIEIQLQAEYKAGRTDGIAIGVERAIKIAEEYAIAAIHAELEPDQRRNDMSSLDVMIPADNELAYEQGWNDCLNIVMRKLANKRDQINEPMHHRDRGIYRAHNECIDVANSARDMQSAIAWAQDQGMFTDRDDV